MIPPPACEERAGGEDIVSAFFNSFPPSRTADPPFQLAERKNPRFLIADKQVVG